MNDGSSSKLTVYYDGQFWVGLCERHDRDGSTVCRTVFGAEPSDEQIACFVNARWAHLQFSPSVPDAMKPRASNPKRRAREAARELAAPAMSTKAQAALSAQHEQAKHARQIKDREQRDRETERRFALKQLKRKEKKRGH